MSSFGHAERARREHVEFRRIIRAHDVGGVAKLLLLVRIVIIAAGDLHHAGSHEIGGGVLTDHIRIDPGQLGDPAHVGGAHHAASARREHAALHVAGQHESTDRFLLDSSGGLLSCPRNRDRG